MAHTGWLGYIPKNQSCATEALFTISGKLDGEMLENLSQSYLEQVVSRDVLFDLFTSQKLVGKLSSSQRIHAVNIYLHFPIEFSCM